MQPKCENCRLRKLSKRRVLGDGPEAATFMLVGEAPGAVEETIGKPFVGPAGRVLRAQMYQAGLDPRWVYITNVVKCRPPQNRTPFPDEIECCKPLLLHELHTIQPKVVYLLGEVALYALFPHLEGITKWRGTPLRHDEFPNTIFLPTLHPAYTMRNPDTFRLVVVDFGKGIRYIHTPPKTEWPTLHVNPTLEEFRTFLEKHKELSVDIETFGLEPWDVEKRDKDGAWCSIRCIAFGTHEYAMSVPWTSPYKEVARKWLEDDLTLKIFQNGLFDLFHLRWAGVKVKNYYYDTRYGGRLYWTEQAASPLSEEKRRLKTDLETWRSIYTDYPPYKEVRKRLHVVSEREVMEYNCKDVIVTHTVYKKQWKDLTLFGLTEVWENITKPLLPVLHEMEVNGILTEERQFGVLLLVYKPRRDKLLEEIRKKGIYNPNSPHEIKRKLRVPSSRHEVLVDLSLGTGERAELAKLILEYREVEKIISTFLKGLWNSKDPDGYIHPHYDPAGTATGRLASRDPNLQNIPIPVRSLFIAHSNNVLVEVDYSQLELRVAAVLAKEDRMLKQFEEGVDIHTEMAHKMFPNLKEVDRKHRSMAKGIVFGSIYGLSPRTVSRVYKVPVSTAESWFAICLTTYPRLVKFRDKMVEEATKKGYLRTPFGRIRWVSRATQALNFPVQSSASDITLTTLIELYRAGYGPNLRLTVHDSIVLELPKDKVEEELPKIRSIVERPIPQLDGYRFPAKYQIGRRWSFDE